MEGRNGGRLPHRGGARPRVTLRDRLPGLWLTLFGLASFAAVVLILQTGLDTALQPPTPPNLPPLVSPLRCLLPIIALGAIGLVWVGIRRFFDPF